MSLAALGSRAVVAETGVNASQRLPVALEMLSIVVEVLSRGQQRPSSFVLGDLHVVSSSLLIKTESNDSLDDSIQYTN
jgi:hypothetical protein